MAIKKVYIGSVGPFLFDDTDLVNDEDGDFPGATQKGVTVQTMAVYEAPVSDEDVVRNVDLGSVLSLAVFNANTIVAANEDDTPLALEIPEQTLVGRIAAGVIDALTASEVRTLINVEDGSTADRTKSDIEGLELSHDSLTDVSINDHGSLVVDNDGDILTYNGSVVYL